MSSPTAHELSISPAASGAWAGAALLGTSPANNSGGGGGPSGQRKASKGKARDREAYGSSPIALLPLELLAHVFAHLPPQALGTCQLVCTVWNEVVGDEGSWRTAFETYYDVSPDSLGRRLEPGSWRLEYITRVSLLRQWHRSRTPTILHNPSLGAIDSIHVHLPSAVAPASTSRSSRSDSPSLTATPLLSVSLPLGAAVHSAPFTGKLSKRPLLSSPIDHLGRPLGLPIIPAKSFAVSPDGARLIWGMRDGSLRFSNSSTPGGGLGIPGGGRGTVGGAIEQGEVRALLNAHREGSSVVQVAFSNAGGTGGGRVLKGIKQRFDVFATAGADGVVALWSLSVPPAAAVRRERAPPAVKLWQARWDVALDLPPASSARASPGASEAPARPRVKPTALALDAGWLGRHHGRPASLAVGRSDGKTVVWRRVELDEEKLAADGGLAAQASEPVVLDPPTREEGEAVDTLIFDPAESATAPLSLLVHQVGAQSFERYVFPPLASIGGGTALTSRTTFGHPLGKEYLSAVTAFAVDFDPPPAVVAPSQPQTPAEGKPATASSAGRIVSLHPSSTLPSMPSLSRTVSEMSLQPSPSPSLSISLSTFDSSAAADDLPSSSRFGRRKYVAAGDSSGRVFLWDWEAKQSEDEAERGEVVGPSKAVQGLEIEGGGEASASKVTALEVTEVGVFVGGLDGTLRFYSSLGPAQLLSPPLRTFRDRSAPRHPARHLAAGLIAPDEEERWLVSHVRASRDAVVAAIGGRVLAWRLSGGEVKKKVGVKGKGGFSARQERFKANLELQHQVRESISAISAESAARLEAHEDARRRSSEFGLPPSLGNMTEEEAVAFATMLSLDEQEASLFADDSQDWEQLPEEWMGEEVNGFVLDEDYERRRASTSGTRWTTEDEGDEEDDLAFSSRMTSRRGSREQSLSTSLSVPTSPYLRNGSLPITSSSSTSRFAASSSPGRSGVQHTWTPVSPSLLAVGSPPSSFNPNGKVQVSPRLGPTYGSHGALYVNEAVPDMSPELWPTAAASSPASPPSRRLSLAGPSPLGPAASMSPPFSALPAPVASTSAASVAAAATSTPIRRGWSAVARSTPASSSSSPSALRGSSSPQASTSPPAWPSPSLGASYTPPPKPTASSLLAEQLRASELSAREEEARRRAEREQEELDLAIALSLSASQAGAEGGEGDEVGELRI